MKKSRKLSLAVGGAVVAVVGAVWGYTTLDGATPVDASKLATVEQGTMTRSVVATGKIEPITKVEIKSKANGIIERLNADVDQVVEAGAILVELDKENLTGARAGSPREPPGGAAPRSRPPRRSSRRTR